MAKRQRRQTRSQRRDAQLAEAARVLVPPAADVCVLGGGAAGLVAAIVAAERGARVVVLERAVECGRTILATGNGRCNFANTQLEPAHYNDPAFVGAVAGERWFDDIVDFFEAGCGLSWAEEAEGRCYPASGQAASVRNVLLARAREAGVTLAPARAVRAVHALPGAGKRGSIPRCTAGAAGALQRACSGSAQASDTSFRVDFDELFGEGATSSIEARRVVVATGGSASEGMAAACGALGLRTTELRPVLCPLACEGPLLAALDGRRVRAQASLLRSGEAVTRERGEVLFRSYGLSGIVVFNLSRLARSGDELALDLLPHLTHDAACRMAHRTLDGLLDPVVARALLGKADGSPRAAIALAKELRLRVTGLAEAERAQVGRGGLANDQFDPPTLEAREVLGLFACGEALDVDGPCGGFNLSWAWKSGMVAGAAAGGSAATDEG